MGRPDLKMGRRVVPDSCPADALYEELTFNERASDFLNRLRFSRLEGTELSRHGRAFFFGFLTFQGFRSFSVPVVLAEATLALARCGTGRTGSVERHGGRRTWPSCAADFFLRGED